MRIPSVDSSSNLVSLFCFQRSWEALELRSANHDQLPAAATTTRSNAICVHPHLDLQSCSSCCSSWVQQVQFNACQESDLEEENPPSPCAPNPTSIDIGSGSILLCCYKKKVVVVQLSPCPIASVAASSAAFRFYLFLHFIMHFFLDFFFLKSNDARSLNC